jgi:hypothetical protein
MEELGNFIELTAPSQPPVFSGPFSIAWKNNKQSVNVREWMLLVGTSDGDWDIMSASMSDRTRAAIDISDMDPSPQRIYVRLRYAVYDPDHRKPDEDDGEDRWFITPVPFEINKKVA